MSDKCKRKIIKLEYMDCGSIFNNDYKLKHERQVHSGKKIKTKHYGVPSILFEASKQSKQVQIICS
ncbi:zinc finger MYM-type protein 1-like, partial [Aphis craccivora]